MKNRVISKALAVAVIILFLGLAIQPINANVQTEEETIDDEPKDNLFQTIIDIANNPEIKNLFEQYNYDLFKIDMDRSIYRKILFRNPRLMFNILFTKPSMSVEYLDKCYNNGIGVTNILGDDKTIEIIENIEDTDIKLFDELNKIIFTSEELTERISVLKEMNNKFKYANDWEEHPIICNILYFICLNGYIRNIVFYEILSHIKENPTIEFIIKLFIAKAYWIFTIFDVIGIIFCWDIFFWY